MSSVFQRILVPTDGSPPSEAAVALGIELAAEQRGELLFVHVVDTNDVVLAAADTPFDPTPTLDAMQSYAQDLMRTCTERATQAHASARTRIIEGHPVDAILDAAREFGATLLILGTHGRSGLEHLLLGSTTEKVLHRAEAPVLVTRGTGQPPVA